MKGSVWLQYTQTRLQQGGGGWVTHCKHLSGPDIKQSQLLVLTSGGNDAPVIAPRHGINSVLVEAVKREELLARDSVPNDDLVVKAVGGQDVGGTRVP